jgi:hypothetical protein
MRRGDKIDVVTAVFLQLQHDACQLIAGQGLSLTLMADIKILTKYTQEVAMGKKDGSRAVAADQRCFFAKVGAVTGYPGPCAGFANTGFAFEPIHAALARTQGAFAHALQRPGGSVFQPARLMGMQICGLLGWHGQTRF